MFNFSQCSNILNVCRSLNTELVASLAAHDLHGTIPIQSATAESSGVSLGTVNRVFRALRERTPPFLEGRRNDLTRPDVLEREWISVYSAQQPAAWPEQRFTSDVWTIPDGILNVPLPEGALFSSEVAAVRLGASIRPASVLIHVDGDDRTRKELIRHGRLRRDENGMIRLRPALWRTAELEFPVIGAAARDLVIHSRQRSEPTRATKDIDIAVAVRGDEDFRALTQVLDRRGRAPHKFIVHGVEVDVIAFGGNEADRAVTFSDGSVFDATGISEAHSTSVSVRFPRGTEVQVASPAALTALKILAWRERYADNPKDALDLATILTAMSESPFDDAV